MALFDGCDTESLGSFTRSIAAGPASAQSCASRGEGLLGTTLGVYRLDATLGCGAVGVVYRAWDCRARRVVAVKVCAWGCSRALLIGVVSRWRHWHSDSCRIPT